MYKNVSLIRERSVTITSRYHKRIQVSARSRVYQARASNWYWELVSTCIWLNEAVNTNAQAGSFAVLKPSSMPVNKEHSN